MIVGLLTGLLIAAINVPLAHLIARLNQKPAVFGLIYFPVGLVAVVLVYFVVSLVIVPSLQVYGLVALLSYASIGGGKMRELRKRRKASRAQARQETVDVSVSGARF